LALCPLLGREYLEKLFHVPCWSDSRVDSLLMWGAVWAICPAKPPSSVIWLPQVTRFSLVRLYPRAKHSHLLLQLRLLPRLLLWWHRSS
jgi:hypothetical protein